MIIRNLISFLLVSDEYVPFCLDNVVLENVGIQVNIANIASIGNGLGTVIRYYIPMIYMYHYFLR